MNGNTKAPNLADKTMLIDRVPITPRVKAATYLTHGNQ
jgi:hypothetical protein